jgi:hypothetical protein
MKIKFIPFVIIFLLFNQIKAQITGDIDYKMPQIIGQTPDVASLLKFSETSVSYSTGIPNISIPIFTLPSGDLSTSVGISYHAGGIRVSEDASNVGLGWSLFAGGQITRTVRSHPDDLAPYGYIYNPYTVDIVSDVCNNGSTFQGQDCHYYSGENAEVQSFDYEPDEFNYSMMGLSGRFMFNQDRSVSAKGEIVQFPHNNVEITPIFSGNEITSWNIKDDKGTMYYFQKGNTQHKTDYFEKINGQLVLSADPQYTPEYIETWDLTSVVSHKGDVITFNYITPQLPEGFGWPHFNEHNFMESSDALVVQEGQNTSNSHPLILPRRVNLFSHTERKYTTLKSIVSSLGKIEIIYDTQRREDMQSDKYRIKYIELYDNHNKLLKNVEFKHSYYNSEPASQNYFFLNDSQWNQNTLGKRLRLDEVVFRGYISNPEPISTSVYSYVLDYNNTNLPNKRSYAQDHWGYYNGVSNNASLIAAPNYSSIYLANREVDTLFSKAGILKSIRFPEGGKTEYVFENNTEDSLDPLPPYVTTNTVFQDNLNTPHTITQNGPETTYKFKKDFTIGNDAKPEGSSFLTHMTFSGFTTRCPNNTDEIFDLGDLVCNKILLKIYEMNNGVQGQEIHNDHIWSTGFIVVEKNKDYRAIIEITSSDEENYNFDNNSSEANISWQIDNPGVPAIKYLGGLRIKEIKNFDDEDNLASHRAFKYKGGKILSKPSYFSVTAGNIRKFVSQSWVPLLTSQSGYVHYAEVTEEFMTPIEGDPNVVPLINLNSIIRKYTNNSPPIDFPTAPFIWNSYLGLLIEERIPLVSKKTQSYVSRVSQLHEPVKGFVIRRPYYIDENISPFNIITQYEWLDCLNNGLCDITNSLYTLNSVSRLLKNQDEESIFYDDFNSQNLMVQSKDFFYESLNPDLNLLSKTITQTSDGAIIENHFKYAYDVGDQNLITSNRISSPLETTTLRDGVQISSVKAYYNNFGGDYLIDNIKVNKAGEPLEERLKYHRYNSLGKPVEVSQTDGTHVFYIYGYNSNYPIAEIKNFTYNESLAIQNLIDVAVLASNLDDDTTTNYSGNEGQLRLALENIKNHSALSNSLITTYTYDPLVGITSVTDIRNYTIYYQYDNLGRLKQVKDAEGNILSKNEYKYATQN